MYATIHDEMIESISHLDEATQGKVILAYIKYQMYWTEPSQDDILVYSIFKAKQFDLDSSINKAEIARENWKKWGAPKWNQNAVKNYVNTTKQPKTTKEQPRTTQNNHEKEKEKEKEKENNNNHPTDEFEDSLLEFKKMRQQIKKPITQRWLELVKTKLQKMYPDRQDLQIMCINKSIENSWQWVFELSNEDIRIYKKKLDEEKKKEIRQNLSEKVIEMSEEDKARIRQQYADLRKNVLRSI